MIDASIEKLISFSEAASLVPFPVAPSTIARWATVGVRGHRLESIVIGRRRLTSAAAISRLLDVLNAELQTAATA